MGAGHIDDVLFEYNRVKEETGDEDLRVIIRCDDSASIRNLVAVLNVRGESFIAIHENFRQDGGEDWEYKKVPNPDDIEECIWIHQYKLLEGVDDPRFRILATYNPLSNTRQIIQQVGRIIRNPSQEENQIAYFIDHSNGKQKKLWEEYLDFDETLGEDLPIALNENIANSVLDTLPAVEYVDGRFRRRFEIGEEIEDLLEEVSLPANCNLIQMLDSFSIEELCEFIEDRFDQNDFTFKQHQIDADTFLYFYISFNNSRFLPQKYFIDIKLNLCVFAKLSSGYLAFYDSNGFAPINLEDVGLGKPVHPKLLKKLISQGDGSRLINVSLKNSNLGNKSISSHSFTAASIDETTPFLDDHANVLSSFVGYSFENNYPLKREDRDNSNVRRYLGVLNGKISEGAKVNLADYLAWINHIDSILRNTRRKPVQTFGRYCAESDDVTRTDPRHILLDFSEVDYLRYKDAVTDRIVEFSELSCGVQEVTEGGNTLFRFSLSEGGNEHRVKIEFDKFRKKYILDSPSLDGNFYTDEDQNIISYLNQNQLFRVIPKQHNTVYIHGNFYNPSIKIGSKFDEANFHVGKIIRDVGVLQTTGSEKGGNEVATGCKADQSGWNDNCLFHLIDSRCVGTTMANLFEDVDFLICDDLQAEIADFILSTPNKVVFIHVKGTGNQGTVKYCSASSLQDVCGQATKNIQFLSMFNDEKPPNLPRWLDPWSAPPHVYGSVANRIREGGGTPDEIWDTLQKRINNPLTDREVWLFLGSILSKSRLIEYLSKIRPEPEAIQAAILLHGTMTNVNSIGAKLRIFCHP